MAEREAAATGGAGGTLSVDGLPQWGREPLTVDHVGKDNVTGRFRAVINVHACNLHQIEMAVQANMHEVDPHPMIEGQFVYRHPVILTCFDPATGEETEPPELNIETIRTIYSKRYAHVSPNPPPKDGSHVEVPGMHFVAELDSKGEPTGRVVAGNP